MTRRPVAAALAFVMLVGTLVANPWLLQVSASAQTEGEQATAGDAGQGRRPEIESLRTKYSKTFAEGDGMYTAEISTAPIHFKDDAGSWREIDNELVPCEDASCAWRNSAGPLSVQFAALANDSNMVSVRSGGRGVGFGLLNSRHSRTPDVNGNAITYRDVFPNVDLRYEVMGAQVKELIILNQAPRGPLSARFPLQLAGLTAEQRDSGEIDLLDENGGVHFTIPRLWMEDSAAGPDGEPASSTAVAATLEARGNAQFITVTADEAWLADPERVYPVKIDPYLTKDTDYDTYITTANNDPHNTEDQLKIGTFDGGSTKRRSLVQFDVRDFIGSGRAIRSATLRLYNTSSPSCTARQVDVHRVRRSWSANTVTWGNQPIWDSAPVASNDISLGATGCEPDMIRYPQKAPQLPSGCDVDPWENPATYQDHTNGLTEVARDWARGGDNFGLLVKAPEESNDSYRKLFKSGNASYQKPDLHITYTNPPERPEAVKSADGERTSDTTPVLSAVYDDPDTDDAANTIKDDWGCVFFELRSEATSAITRVRTPISAPGSIASLTDSSYDSPLPYGKYYWNAVYSFDEWLKSGPPLTGEQVLWIDPPPTPTSSPTATPTNPQPQPTVSPPEPPTVSSPTHPDPEAWKNDPSPRFSWSVPNNGGAAPDAFSYSFGTDPEARPDTDPETTENCDSGDPGQWCKRYIGQPNGTYYFYIQARNSAGWGKPAGVKIKVDAEVDKPLLLSSPSHVPGVAFQGREVDIQWSAVDDPDSGTAGYFYAFRQECTGGAPCPHGPPASDPGGEFTSVTTARSRQLDSGTNTSEPTRWWAHVTTKDKAGNLGIEGGQDRYYGPFLIDADGLPFPLNPTLDDSLVAQSDENGLEQFYPYRRHALGTGDAYVQLRTGNVVVQSTDVSIPARGLNTVIKRTYNANRSDAEYHDTGVGKGWTLSLSDADTGLDQAVAGIDLNSPVLPTAADVVDMIGSASGRLIELTDGDGTVHRFVRRGGPGTEWDSPPGVDLTVREYDETADSQADRYEFIRPDGVTYVARQLLCEALNGTCRTANDGPTTGYVPQTWQIVEVRDRNDNKLRIVYNHFPDAGTLGRARAVSIRHNREPNPLVQLNYSPTGTLLDLKTFPAVPADSRTTRFAIDRDGYLASVTDDFGGTDPRTTSYDYRAFSSDLLAPRLLNTVRDGNLNASAFTYVRDEALDKWSVNTFTDREQNLWTYGYENIPTAGEPANAGRITTARTPLQHPTEYTISTRKAISEEDKRIAGGNIAKIKEAGVADSPTVTEQFDWEENLLRSKTDGVGNVTRMEYDELGQITRLDQPSPNNPDRTDLRDGAPKARVETTFNYQYPDEKLAGCAEPSTPDGTCRAVAQMVRSTRANGTQQARVTEFDYDPTNGNLKKVTEKAQAGRQEPDRITSFDYYPDSGGLLSSVTDPKGNVTRFGADVDGFGYHRSGQPKRITDAKNEEQTFVYTAYGLVEEAVDRDGRMTTSVFDGRNNLDYLIAPGRRKTSFTYDGNDNIETKTSPMGKVTSFSYDNNDRLDVVTRAGGRTTDTDYNSDGTKKWVIGPAGAKTVFDYYVNQTLKWVREPAGTNETAQTDYIYDAAGRVRQTIYPSTGAGRPKEQVEYAPSGAADVVRQTSSSGQLDRITKYSYSPHGEVIQVLGPRREFETSGPLSVLNRDYNSFGQVETESRLATSDPQKWLTQTYRYDPAGNLKTLDLPGIAADTVYDYDNLNRLTSQTDPFNEGHTTEFVYSPEGEQKARIDKVNGAEKRRVDTFFNDDGTLRSKVATDDGKVLAQCNFAAGASDPSRGYDPDGNLLITRTVTGGNCANGTTIKTENLTWDTRGFLEELIQTIDPVDGPQRDRRQTFTYRSDGAMTSSTWYGPGGPYKTTYEPSQGGLVEKATPWRSAELADLDYLESGSLESAALGDDITGSLGYHPDGSLQSLRWTAGGRSVRAHTDIDYSLDGLRIAEKVDLARPTASTEFDKSGTASFNYDLAGRLISWTSPFPLVYQTTAGPLPGIASDRDYARTDYTLDAAGNIERERTVSRQVQNGSERVVLTQTTTANYPGGRLSDRTIKVDSNEVTLADSTRREGFCYSGLGEEKRRVAANGDGATLDGCNAQGDSNITTTFDPAGHTNEVTDSAKADVDYLYDADGSVIARTKTEGDGTTNTTYFFYFGLTRTLAEEATPTDRTRVRYFVNSTGEALAQERYEVSGVDAVDNADPGTWTWLLKDPHGSVGTHVKADGTVTKQASYDPYGAPDAGGTSGGQNASTLGFQSAHTDDATGNMLLGARIYDPKIDRFTTADFFVGSGSDLSLATDPLTGNRYLFAAANPVAFYDDGHEPCYVKDCNASYSGTKTQQRERASGTMSVTAAESTAPALTYWGAVQSGVVSSDEWDIATILHHAATRAGSNLPTRARVVAPGVPRLVSRLLSSFGWYSRSGWKIAGNGTLSAAAAVTSYNQFREEGDSAPEAAAKTAGGAVGGTIGSGLATLVACGASAGAACPIAVGFAGFLGSRAGTEFGAGWFGGPYDYPEATGEYTGVYKETWCGPGVYSTGC